MNRQQLLVANAFYAASCFLGLPSLLALCWGAWGIVQFRLLAPASSPPTPRIQSGNSAIDLLEMGGRAVGAVFGAISTMGSWVIYAVTAFALAGILLSTALFFTGRGLYLYQPWAKFAGTGFLSILLLLSLAGGLSLPRSLIVGVCGYSLWILWTRQA